MGLFQTKAVDRELGHGDEGGRDVEHEGGVGDVPVIGVDVTVVARLGLKHVDIAKGLAVLDQAVDAKESFGVAVENDISPNNRVRLFLMRGSKCGLVHHNGTFGIHLIIGLESYVVIAAESVCTGKA